MNVREQGYPTAIEENRMRERRGGWSWGAVPTAKLRALSLGAGVQSTTLALMASHGEIGPMPDLAIFADTGDEIAATMEHLAWLRSGNVLKFPVRIVTRGERISDAIRRRAQDIHASRFVSPPFFTSGGGQGRRQCTREFKVEPITKAQREAMGYRPRQRIPRGSCEIWIGFSTDEVVRAGAAFDRWAVNRFPLLELRMSRWDCEQWLRRHDYPVPPKSACLFCPYRSDTEWRSLRDNDPDAWRQAIDIDRLIRNTPRMRHAEYLHASRRPLEDIDLSTAEDRGQANWLTECEGGCGL